MNQRNVIFKVTLLAGALFLFFHCARAQGSFDSLKIKLPKHYFQTVIIIDGYRKPDQAITDTTDFLSKRLKTYGVNQFAFTLNTPLVTFERPTYDSTLPKKNTHLLLTANYMRLRPVFAGIPNHDLIKAGIGIRLVVNNGKKGIWFIESAPFITRDATYADSDPYVRMANTIIYSHNKSERFNWRVGITKSFLWGNRNYLPFIGVRFGRLDKTHLSIQVPRSISLNVPVNEKLFFSFYTRPQGGMWNFSNRDSLYYLGSASTFHFTRYEINTGFRLDVRVSNWFHFYTALGLSTRNNITFYSNKENPKKQSASYQKFFYSQTMPATGFLNLGLVFKFGRTKSYYNDKNIYDAIDLNNTIGGGDDNLSNGNAQIPYNAGKKADLNLKSVQDLIDYNDF